MNRLFPTIALVGLIAAGCSVTPEPAANNAPPPAPPPAPATPPAAAAPPASTNSEKASPAPQGDVTGAYFPAKTLPGDFSELEHLYLATIDQRGDPAPLNGFLRPKRRSDKDYKLENLKLNGKELTFSTSTVAGVGYTFKGAFEKLRDFAADPPPPDEVVLKGKLTRLRDGGMTAETDVSFTYSAGD